MPGLEETFAQHFGEISNLDRTAQIRRTSRINTNGLVQAIEVYEFPD